MNIFIWIADEVGSNFGISVVQMCKEVPPILEKKESDI